jgi:hypothetical protein
MLPQGAAPWMIAAKRGLGMEPWILAAKDGLGMRRQRGLPNHPYGRDFTAACNNQDAAPPRRRDKGSNIMKRAIVLSLIAFGLGSLAARAQDAKPTYEGAPDTYKVIFENQDFRVIEATWKAGATDKPHTHPVPSVIYNVTGCTLKLHSADGKVREATAVQGTANAVPLITQPHTAENIGPTDCRAIIVERK